MALKMKSMEEIAAELKVRKPTAEVYVIDGLVAGAPVEMNYLLQELEVTTAIFVHVKRELESERELSLRAIKDNLAARDLPLQYNQIRGVIACLINGHEVL